MERIEGSNAEMEDGLEMQRNPGCESQEALAPLRVDKRRKRNRK